MPDTPSTLFMPRPTAIGSAHAPRLWSPWLTSNAALPAATAKLHQLAEWAKDAANGLMWFPANGLCCMQLCFLQARAAAADPNNLTSTGRMWITEDDSFAPDDTKWWEGTAYYAGDLALTCGNTAVLATSRHLVPVVSGASGPVVMPNGYGAKYTDTIAVTNDGTLSPGIRHIGAPAGVADIWDRIVFDLAGGTGVLVAIKRDNVDAVRVGGRPF